MKKIKILFPYFGKFPSQFKFWWASALNNPDVSFIIVTDNHSVHSEANIQVVYMDFEDCKNRVQRCFDFPVAMPSPYKLCDLKPAYRLIFSDLLSDSDFWGWGDMDLIYGDIRSLVTEEVLAQYDMISGWGHLTLLRNDDYWNKFFMLQVDGFKDYRQIYQNPGNFGFDEYWHQGTADKAMHLHPDKVWNSMLFDDLRTPETHLNFKSGMRRMYENDHLIFEYKDKQMYRVYLVGENICKEPIMYMHFKRRLSILRPYTDNTEHYLIVPNKIIPYEELTWEKIYKWTEYGILRQWCYTMRCRLSRKIKKISLIFSK